MRAKLTEPTEPAAQPARPRLEPPDEPSGSGAAVAISAATKTFRGPPARPAIADVDLRIPAGSITTVVGPSGTGKSTLLRLIAGLTPLDAGTIEVDGRAPDRARAQHLLSLVPQTPALLPWKTVDANVRVLVRLVHGRAAAGAALDADVDDILAKVGLTDARDALPRQLSGGMQQRVSLARAFLHRAPLLLMDEPFAALDELTRNDMRYLLLDLWAEVGCTVVFVTHSLAEAVALSDQVVVLVGHPGRVAAVRPIELERPRSEELEDDPRFHDEVRALRDLLREVRA